MPAINFQGVEAFRHYTWSTWDAFYGKAFGFVFYGTILIEREGQHTICVESRDGARLWLDRPVRTPETRAPNSDTRFRVSDTRNSKDETRDTRHERLWLDRPVRTPETRNLIPETRKMKPETRILNTPGIRHPEPETPNPKHEILPFVNPKPWTPHRIFRCTQTGIRG